MKKVKSMAGREPNYVLHWLYVMAIVPYYDEANNTRSRVYYFDGSVESYNCRCEQILEDLAVAFRTSLEVVRNRAVARTNQQVKLRKVPLVLTKWFCLVPVKCREELVPKTGTLGYLVYNHIDSVKAVDEGSCQVLFKNLETRLDICQQKRTVQYQMGFAVWLQKQREAEEQHWQYEFCIAHKRMQQQIAKKKKQMEQTAN